jgi:MFS family permease
MRNRDYRLAWAGIFVSNVGTWMETLAVSTHVTRITGEAKWTATVAALTFIPAIVLGPLGGALADRFDRRRYLFVCTFAQALFAAALLVLTLAGALTVPAVMAVMTLNGCASALAGPALNSLLVDFVPPEDVVGAVNFNSVQFNLARILGPALAAPIIKLFGLAWAFGLNTLSFVAVVVALARVRMPREHDEAPTGAPSGASTPGARVAVEREPLLEGIRTALKTAAQDRGTRAALGLAISASFLVSPFIALVPVMAMQLLHRDEGAAASLAVMQGLGAISLAVSVVPLSDRFGRARVVAVAGTLFGPVAMLYWLSPGPLLAHLLLFLLGAVHLGTVTGCNSVCQSRARRSMRARITSLYSLFIAVGYSAGCPTIGALGDRFGLRLVSAAGGLLFLVLVVGWRLLEPTLFSAMDAPIRASTGEIPALSLAVE